MRRAARFLLRLFAPRSKFAIFFLVFLIAWPFLIPILAFSQEIQSSPPPPTYAAQEYASDVPRDENSAMQGRVINILSAIGCQLTGINPAYPDRPCLGVDQTSGELSFLPKTDPEVVGGGAIGFVNTMMIATFQAPTAETGKYLAYLGDNFGIAKPAEAQGIGFTSLDPVLPLWTAARNVAYLFYIAVFVIIGILVMIRVRIDPRTVMTIQNQIPKVVVGILLITFSYAITGFLIDMMYVTLHLATNIITSVKVEGQDYSTLGPRMIRASNPLYATAMMYEKDDEGPDDIVQGLAFISWGPAQEIGEAIGGLFDNPLGEAVTTFLTGAFVLAIGGQAAKSSGSTGGTVFTILTAVAGLGGLAAFTGVGLPLGIGLGALTLLPRAAKLFTAGTRARSIANVVSTVGAVGGGALVLSELLDDKDSIRNGIFSVIAFIIIAVAILSSLIRLWFALMKAYILILINTTMAPFYILFGLFPGSAMTFSSWIRAQIANLSAFPVTIIMLLLGRILIDGLGGTQTAGVFVPPLLGNASVSGSIQAIVGLTFILMTPSVVDIMRGILSSKPSQYTGGISVGAAAGVAYFSGLIRNPLSILSQAEEARWDVDTGRYQKTGTLRTLFRRATG